MSTATIIKSGSVITARTSDTGTLVWFYVIACLPDGKAFGVNVGSNAATVSPEGSGFRFDTATVEHYGEPDSLSRLSSTVLDALSSFLVAAGLPAVTGTDAHETREEAYARGVTDGRTAATREFDAWKASATETAHEYADRNDLCSEFDRCMTEIGLEPRGGHTYRVTFDVTLPRGEDPWDYDMEDLQGISEDWERVAVERV